MNRSATILTEEATLAMSHASTDIGEGIGRSAPAHIALDVSSCVPPDPIALGSILEQAGHRGGEIFGPIRQHNIVAVPHGKPFDADASRHDSLAHGHGLVGLDTRAAPDAERDHEEGAPSDMGANVLHPADHSD